MSNPKPSEIREFLTRQIQEWKTGWTNYEGPDMGKVTNEGALRAVAILTRALDFIPDETRKGKIIIPRNDIEQVIAEAQKEAKRFFKIFYVGSIGFPDGSQIYADATLGFTDDKELLASLGKIYATVTAVSVERHA